MPRKTRKQKLKALFHRIKGQQLNHSVGNINNFTSNIEIKPIQNLVQESSIREEKHYIVSDIFKSVIIFALLAIFQYAVYYGIVNNIIKI